MSLTCAPGRIRTRDPLLRRHTLTVARRRWVWPDSLFSCTDTSWTWPGAPYLSLLAPHNRANAHDPGSAAMSPGRAWIGNLICANAGRVACRWYRCWSGSAWVAP